MVDFDKSYTTKILAGSVFAMAPSTSSGQAKSRLAKARKPRSEASTVACGDKRKLVEVLLRGKY